MKSKSTSMPGIDPGITADGNAIPGACNTLSEFVRSLEDGQFDADCYTGIRDLAEALNDHVFNQGGKAKGKVVITLEFNHDPTVTEIRSSFKVTHPAGARAKSLMWQTEDNRMTRIRPGQGQMFGIRDVSGGGQSVRDAV